MDERVLAVQKMQDFIEKNLYKEITLLDLSKVSLFSPWYSYRIFKEYIGLIISDYIRKLRLSKSALKLRDNRTKIIDIAFEMGFKSVDGYQRAFQKEFNCVKGDGAFWHISLRRILKIKYKAGQNSTKTIWV